MNFTQALAEFPKHADRMDKATRRVRWVLRGKLAIWLAGGTVFVSATARMIEGDYPWWAITLGVLMTIPYGVGAANLRPQFERLREMRATWANVRDIVEDEDFQAFVKVFAGPAPTSVTVDEDTDPADPPAPTSEGTKP